MKNERNPLFFFGACIAFLGLISSCASFPTPSSSDDTLLVVPYLHYDIRVSGIHPMNFSYRINLQHAGTGKIFSLFIGSSDSNDYKYVTGLPPGKYTVKEYQPIGLLSNPVRPFRIQKTFTLEKGVLSVMPLKIIILSIDSEDKEYIGLVQFDYKEVTDKQIARIIDQLREKDGFQRWRH
ncbi:MAG: hypothetical protein JXD23_08795 [Spirochaetales bacterium]|nr:hypothetical protein [Spirochaetales bacterium]